MIPVPLHNGHMLPSADRSAFLMNSDRFGIFLINSMRSSSTLNVTIPCFFIRSSLLYSAEVLLCNTSFSVPVKTAMGNSASFFLQPSLFSSNLNPIPYYNQIRWNGYDRSLRYIDGFSTLIDKGFQYFIPEVCSNPPPRVGRGKGTTFR